MNEKLTFGIKYNINENKCEFYGDVNKEGMGEIVSSWIQLQIGAGEDNTPSEQHDIYQIEIDWYPEDDSFVCRHNCGNKSLREGILMRALQDL